jgi:hypothetical protein
MIYIRLTRTSSSLRFSNCEINPSLWNARFLGIRHELFKCPQSRQFMLIFECWKWVLAEKLNENPWEKKTNESRAFRQIVADRIIGFPFPTNLIHFFSINDEDLNCSKPCCCWLHVSGFQEKLRQVVCL